MRNSFAAFEERGIDTCTTCPKLCRWACPVAEAEAKESTSPWSLVVLSGFLRRGVAPVESVGEFPYHCTHCGACTEACLHKNDVPLLLGLARSRVLDGHAAPPQAIEVRGRFGVAANPYGAPLESQLKELAESEEQPKDLMRPIAAGSTVYLPGCATLIEHPEAARGFLRALTLRGLSGVQLSEVSAGCCGLPLLWAGDLDGFQAHAERYAEALSIADRLVVHDPACAHALRVRYRDFGVHLRPRVIHAASFFAERFGLAPEREADLGETLESSGARMGGSAPIDLGGAEQASHEDAIAYLDSCHLCRGLKLAKTPRRLVAKATGSEPIELPGLRGPDADCCGAAGLLPATAPATATAMAEARISAFRQTGAKQLAVFSPRCLAHLKRVDPSIDALDVATLLGRL
jgi:Fe-S oxidoreductase